MRTFAFGLALVSLVGCGDPEPKFGAPVTLQGRQVSAEMLNRGHRLYEKRCASCHGSDGSGQGPAARGLQVAPRDFRKADFSHKSTPEGELPTDEDLGRVIRHGVVTKGMPAWPGLTDEDLDAVVQYLKTFSPRWAGGSGPPAEGT